MARILIGWELGGGRGHAVRLARLAALLGEAGHSVAIAAQRIDAIAPAEAASAELWQAPVSPRLLVSGSAPRSRPPGDLAEILARLGFDDAAIVAAMIGGWRRLFGAVRPDLVLTEFAPFLLLAARGRLPAIAVGTGFELPPAHLEVMPALIEGAARADQAALLATVNAGAAATGAGRVETLPALFAAERVFPATFAELDPYAAHRREPLVGPLPPAFAATAGDGGEVFVYAADRTPADAALWRGLAEAKVPVRVHVPGAAGELSSVLARFGFAFEPLPLPFPQIAARSRLLVSHGGHGFVCAGLAAGLPQVVCHADVEKLLHGVAVARLRLGGHVPFARIEPRAFGTSLAALYRDEALTARARKAGAGLRARDQVPWEQAVTEAVAELV